MKVYLVRALFGFFLTCTVMGLGMFWMFLSGEVGLLTVSFVLTFASFTALMITSAVGAGSMGFKK